MNSVSAIGLPAIAARNCRDLIRVPAANLWITLLIGAPARLPECSIGCVRYAHVAPNATPFCFYSATIANCIRCPAEKRGLQYERGGIRRGLCYRALIERRCSAGLPSCARPGRTQRDCSFAARRFRWCNLHPLIFLRAPAPSATAVGSVQRCSRNGFRYRHSARRCSNTTVSRHVPRQIVVDRR